VPAGRVACPDELRKGLEQLRADAARGTSQWATYGLPSWLRPLVSFEEDAVRIETFEPVLVPGLLQTEEYARAIHAGARRKVPPEYVDKWVAARMQRQRRLNGPAPVALHVVISEAVLRLEVGGRDVFARQLESLVDAAASDHVTVQVIAEVQDGYSDIASNFTVLHFDEPDVDPPLGYFDGPLGGYVVSDEGDVARMRCMFKDVCQLALPEETSTKVLTDMLRGIRQKGSVNG
jgi:hypothetical protein